MRVKGFDDRGSWRKKWMADRTRGVKLTVAADSGEGGQCGGGAETEGKRSFVT